MSTSREACCGWGGVELSFLGATFHVSTHAPSTCTDIPTPRAGPGSYRASGGGLQGCPRGVSDPGGPRRSSNAARAPAASAPRLDLWHFTGVVHQPGVPT